MYVNASSKYIDFLGLYNLLSIGKKTLEIDGWAHERTILHVQYWLSSMDKRKWFNHYFAMMKQKTTKLGMSVTRMKKKRLKEIGTEEEFERDWDYHARN